MVEMETVGRPLDIPRSSSAALSSTCRRVSPSASGLTNPSGICATTSASENGNARSTFGSSATATAGGSGFGGGTVTVIETGGGAGGGIIGGGSAFGVDLNASDEIADRVEFGRTVLL